MKQQGSSDDYITKLFSAPELLVRIRTASANSAVAQSGKFAMGDLATGCDKHRFL